MSYGKNRPFFCGLYSAIEFELLELFKTAHSIRNLNIGASGLFLEWTMEPVNSIWRLES